MTQVTSRGPVVVVDDIEKLLGKKRSNGSAPGSKDPNPQNNS